MRAHSFIVLLLSCGEFQRFLFELLDQRCAFSFDACDFLSHDSTDGAVCRVMSFGANGGYMSGVWLVDYANDMVHPPIPHASLLTTRAQTSSLDLRKLDLLDLTI